MPICYCRFAFTDILNDLRLFLKSLDESHIPFRWACLPALNLRDTSRQWIGKTEIVVRRFFFLRIMRCNRKGIGLRIKTALR